MRLLLDTHTLIWFAMGSSKLSDAARLLIEDANHEKYVSSATIWEMAIKHSLGKLHLQQPLALFIAQNVTGNGFEQLPIANEHVFTVAQLPFHHRDPFDRMLVAQSLAESMPLVSIDASLDQYGMQRLW